MSEPFIAEIRPFGFNFPPRGWAQCDGQLLPISQFQSLFALIGTMYGGNGTTTFALPDLRGRVPLHMASGFVQGSRSGTEVETLSSAQMPSHTHTRGTLQGRLLASSAAATTSDPTLAVSLAAANAYNDDPPSVDMRLDSLSFDLNNVGGSQAHSNMPPALAINFCIALTGIFPSRN